MQDWACVLILMVLFILPLPGLLCQIPGMCRFIEFDDSHTSAVSIIVPAVIFFCSAAVFLVAIGVHIDLGS